MEWWKLPVESDHTLFSGLEFSQRPCSGGPGILRPGLRLEHGLLSSLWFDLSGHRGQGEEPVA